jgi:hypothetical protein
VGAIRVDTSQWPVVIFSWDGDQSDADIERMCRNADA